MWKHTIKNVFTLRSLKFSAIAFGIFLGFLYVVAGGQGEYVRGYRQGTLAGALTQLSSDLRVVASERPEHLVNLSDSLTRLTKIQSGLTEWQPKAGALNFLPQIISGLKSYQSAYDRADLQAAREALRTEVAPANLLLYNQIERQRNANEDYLRVKNVLVNVVKSGFLIFGVLGLMSAISLLTEAKGLDSRNEFGILESKLCRTMTFAMARYFTVDDDGEKHNLLNMKLSSANFLVAFQPSISLLTSPYLKEFRGQSDLNFELELAESFAYFRTKGTSQFSPPPKGAINVNIDQAVLAHALIQWLDQLARYQEVQSFRVDSEWANPEWIVTISTVGTPIHESIVTSYHQVMTKSVGIDKKHHEELDFVRYVLKEVCTGYEIHGEGGNLNLVLRFSQQNNLD